MANRKSWSILCPNCRKLISVGESRCPYCGTGKPGSWWKRTFWPRDFLGDDQFIKAVIYVNVAMFIISLFFDPSSFKFSSLSPFTLLSPDNRSLLLLGGTGTIPVIRLERWWTLVSANYLHGSLLHILFNMVVFKQLATLILQEYGTHRTFTIYTFSGILGFGVSVVAGISFTIGASAAVFGLIGAALYFGKSRGGAYGQSIYRQIGGWAIGLFVFGLIVPGINNWAHGGGMVGGGLFGYLLGYRERVRESLFHKILGSACGVLTIGILVWAIISGLYYRLLG